MVCKAAKTTKFWHRREVLSSAFIVNAKTFGCYEPFWHTFQMRKDS